MIKKKALIEWSSREHGGRSKPPLGVGDPAYSTVVRWVANVHFLAEEAPHGSLREGREFELYEGNKCIARGRVLAG